MKHRRQLPAAAPCDDIGDLFDQLKDTLGKADAFVSSAERQLEEAPSGDKAEDDRRRLHVEHLVEATKFAVRAATDTTQEIRRRVRS